MSRHLTAFLLATSLEPLTAMEIAERSKFPIENPPAIAGYAARLGLVTRHTSPQNGRYHTKHRYTLTRDGELYLDDHWILLQEVNL